MKKAISLLTTSLVLLLATSTASAIPINGIISLAGNAATTYNSSTTEIKAVDFDSSYVGIANGDFAANGVTVLDMSVSAFGSNVIINDIADPITLPISPLWLVEGFTFNLENIISNTVASGGAIINGNGTMSHAGYDDTLFTWVFTTQVGSDKTTFSARSVPAPAGAALLGLGLLGFGFARRNKKAS
ncbi:2-deoxy-D-gluconate-3-dehydrogenase [Psychromonas ingrahamii 37]|uniref:2-deoxy-D-gluconate-3-dehydrogenase n=1 Tax=Psychromonas ingrahamii (strain DSM 17664 / CCUG 51855 / 37) TaxID=357804 RepID=A1SS17_PSYIN|nr:PEP-CTERM sorting domain-containing protein [Psychromonas ingrahamii]ABM02282.1 2-deoxy-D-gluconate-3-dehydrogenase [Psychromonas ingrahamii 37]